MAMRKRIEDPKEASHGKSLDATPSKTRTAAERLKLIYGAAGIYFCFIQYGRIQERIFAFKSPAGKKFQAVWFLSFIDALANVLVGGVGRAIQGNTLGLPQSLLALCGLGQVVSKYCLSASLAAGLSFPVATLAKSAKLVPVMIGSLFAGQMFGVRQLVQASAIVGGTSVVTLSEGGGKGKQSSLAGLLLIAGALSCDGLVGGIQKRLKAETKRQKQELKPYDLMFWTNFWMAIAALGFAIIRSEFREGWTYCRKNPTIFKDVFKFGLFGAFGQASIFYTIANFDSVTCTAITTTRKLLSVLISLFEGEKQLTPLGWTGLIVASAGITGEIV